jgi:hypothetical protein
MSNHKSQRLLLEINACCQYVQHSIWQLHAGGGRHQTRADYNWDFDIQRLLTAQLTRSSNFESGRRTVGRGHAPRTSLSHSKFWHKRDSSQHTIHTSEITSKELSLLFENWAQNIPNTSFCVSKLPFTCCGYDCEVILFYYLFCPLQWAL